LQLIDEGTLKVLLRGSLTKDGGLESDNFIRNGDLSNEVEKIGRDVSEITLMALIETSS
jgi:hypothetical protein